MRTLAEWLEHQQRQHVQAIDLGLERVRRVADGLSLQTLPYPTILVGGTNGKGSTVAFLTALARAMGLRTGTFTSPHLVRYTERITIDGAEVAEAQLLAAFDRVERARGSTPLTFFEYSTLAAHVAFCEAGIELGIIEVGLGGRLDATNAFDPDVSVVCSIGLDHMDYLGPDLESIGREKAGVFRAGRPAVLGSADNPQSIDTALLACGALPRRPPVDFRPQRAAVGGGWDWLGWNRQYRGLPAPALAGPIQYANAATAIAALEALCETRAPHWQARLDSRALSAGIANATLRGRFQVLAGAPEWIFDVAHNPAAAAVLATSLRERGPAARTRAILGVLADKDPAGIVGALGDVVDEWLLCTIEGPRGLGAGELQRRAGLSGQRLLFDSVAAACAAAARRSAAADRILVCGSFHTVGPALVWHGL